MMTKQMEDLRGKGGGRLKHCTADGDVPLCLRKTKEIAMTRAAAKERCAKKREARKKYNVGKRRKENGDIPEQP